MTDNKKDLPCAVVRDLLPLYHDGVVSSDTGELIEEHLGTCESCTAELNSIRNEERIEESLIEKGDESYFREFRDGVKALRRNGTVMGVIIAIAVVAVLFAGLQFLNSADIVKVDPNELEISDVCRYDLGTDGGNGFFFTYLMDWSGGFCITCPDDGDSKELDIDIKRTALGGKFESDERNHRYYEMLGDNLNYAGDLSNVEIIKVNGHTIWTKDEGVNTNPPEYIKEIKRADEYDPDEIVSPKEKIIYTDIDKDFVTITYEDLHGIKWDKQGKIIATYTVDEEGRIVSMENYPEKKE